MAKAPINMNTNEKLTDSKNAVEAFRFSVNTNFFCMKKFTTMPMKAEQSSAQNTGKMYRNNRVNDRKSKPVPKREVVPNLIIENPVSFMFLRSFNLA